jgi:hypothetical protein
VAESVPGIDLRLILREANPAIMDRYLQRVAFDPGADHLGGNFAKWAVGGPRPADLQCCPRRSSQKNAAGTRGMETTIREVLNSIRDSR